MWQDAGRVDHNLGHSLGLDSVDEQKGRFSFRIVIVKDLTSSVQYLSVHLIF